MGRVDAGGDRGRHGQGGFFSPQPGPGAATKPEAERVGKYMSRPLLSLERLSFEDPEGKVGYRYGEAARDLETMDYLEFIAR